MRNPSTVFPEDGQKKPITSHYALQMLQSQRKRCKEEDVLKNLDLLGVTWSFVPGPKVFRSPPDFTL